MGGALGYHQAGAAGGPAARVDGQAIANTELDAELRERFGNEVLQDLVNRSLILQEARRQKIEITKPEVDARLQKMLEDPQVKSMLTAGKVTEVDLRRNLTTLMPLDRLAEKRIGADDEKQYLLEHREELETVRVSHIVVGSDIEANAVVNRLKKPGADFAKLAGDCSLDPQTRDKGGDLGELHRSQMEPAVAEVLFRLPVESDSPIIKTEMGYHIFRVTGHKLEYADLQPAIHEILVDSKRGEVMEELRKKAKIEVFKPYKLPEAPIDASPSASPTPAVDPN